MAWGMGLLMAMSGLRAGEVEDLQAKADGGEVAAQVELAARHAAGRGVEKDAGKAAGWYARAAEQGDLEACMALGRLHLGGRGLPKNSAEAAKWFRLAAERGNRAAQCQLARMHLAGAGLAKDEVEAFKWAKLSAAQGDKQAGGILTHLQSRLDAAQRAEAEKRVKDFQTAKPAEGGTQGVPLTAPPLDPATVPADPP